MDIKGKVHLFFEQSGIFKNEFIKLGFLAEDYDIQNNFGQVDHIIDLFSEINKAFYCKKSIFDNITQDDLIIAFFPCIYFEQYSMMMFSMTNYNYRALEKTEAIKKIYEREKNRTKFYQTLLKFIYIIEDKKLRMILENPHTEPHYLKNNFVKKPDLYDKDRTRRGDFFKKPTDFWFFGCKPTNGFTNQQTHKNDIKTIEKSKPSRIAGICSEERSMMSSDYARNFICDNILGMTQRNIDRQTCIFDFLK